MELLRNQHNLGPTLNEGGAELSLWVAVLRQAYIDYWEGGPVTRAAAAEWVTEVGGMFDLICLIYDINPERGRELFLTRPFRRKRSGFAVSPFPQGGITSQFKARKVTTDLGERSVASSAHNENNSAAEALRGAAVGAATT